MHRPHGVPWGLQRHALHGIDRRCGVDGAHAAGAGVVPPPPLPLLPPPGTGLPPARVRGGAPWRARRGGQPSASLLRLLSLPARRAREGLRARRGVGQLQGPAFIGPERQRGGSWQQEAIVMSIVPVGDACGQIWGVWARGSVASEMARCGSGRRAVGAERPFPGARSQLPRCWPGRKAAPGPQGPPSTSRHEPWAPAPSSHCAWGALDETVAPTFQAGEPHRPEVLLEGSRSRLGPLTE